MLTWLTSFGEEASIVTEGAGIFDRVQVVRDDAVFMVIILVDLETWVSGEVARSEFFSYSHSQERLRAIGIVAVVVWEDLWVSKLDIVRSRLSALLGFSERIPARLCNVKRVDKATAHDFLTHNHLQGAVSSKTQYALFLPERYFRVLSNDFRTRLNGNELLVALVTFSHARVFQRDGVPFRSFELVRFSSLLHTTVVGGLAKLISAFRQEFIPGDIMTYADLEWSDGASYRKLGFGAVSDTGPFRFVLDKKSMERHSLHSVGAKVQDQLIVCNLGSRKFVKDFQPTSQNISSQKPLR